MLPVEVLEHSIFKSGVQIRLTYHHGISSLYHVNLICNVDFFAKVKQIGFCILLTSDTYYHVGILPWVPAFGIPDGVVRRYLDEVSSLHAR